ncbi:GNAT family N-acetyltransferase [Patescibacteria group bacterium]|nr:GNAT family N-acetyltransferase [Patescibacteria group bacterium]MBU2264993.1 GNAT family N-acetyltransferase [Patescibacteria group bacterium]
MKESEKNLINTEGERIEKENKTELLGLELTDFEEKYLTGSLDLIKQQEEAFDENDIREAKEDLERCLRNHERDIHYFVAKDKADQIKGLAGYGREELSPEVYYLAWFAVDKELQNQGLGGALLKKIEEELKEKSQARQIIVRAWDKGPDDPLERFYKKFGFEKTGGIPDYWGDGYDLIFFTKRLKPKKEVKNENH